MFDLPMNSRVLITGASEKHRIFIQVLFPERADGNARKCAQRTIASHRSSVDAGMQPDFRVDVLC